MARAQQGQRDGQNVRIDIRWAEGDARETRRHASELVALAPDVILASGIAAMESLLRATGTIPIAFNNVADPVGAGCDGVEFGLILSAKRIAKRITNSGNVERDEPCGEPRSASTEGVHAFLPLASHAATEQLTRGPHRTQGRDQRAASPGVVARHQCARRVARPGPGARYAAGLLWNSRTVQDTRPAQGATESSVQSMRPCHR